MSSDLTSDLAGVGALQEILDETERVRAHLAASPTWAAMLAAVAGLSKAGFSEGAVSATVGELSERLVASLLGGAIARRQNRGSDLIASDGRLVEVKARIATAANRLNRQFNFRQTSTRTDIAYCLTWMIVDGSPTLDQVICVRMPFLIEQVKHKKMGKYCARTTHGDLRKLIIQFAEGVG